MDKLHSSKPMGELISSNNNNNNIINIGGNSNNNNRVKSKEMENISFEISKYPRDLLQRLVSLDDATLINKNDDIYDNDNDDDNDGLNLGLGLSLGGKFGIDKSLSYNNNNNGSKSGGLIRSSSIAGTMPLLVGQQPHEGRVGVGVGVSSSSLVRTSSLPVETEEEWRKRKEMQTLRRMEAKRRRSEKQRGGGGVGGGVGVGVGEEKGVENLKFRGRLEREQQSLGLTSKFIGASMGNLFGGSGSIPVASSINNNNNIDVGKGRTTFGSLQGFLNAQGHGQVVQGGQMGQGVQGQGSSQGSGESLGAGNSSGASELESKTHQASSSGGEARSPASIQSLQERSSQEALGSPGTNKGDTSQRGGSSALETSNQPKASESKKQETGSSSGIEDMPCVFTIGDGPNGRKVEGILYRYGKGEQVRIMCVCHGTFLSPQDFVKHAGGRDVEHPLRHIVVSPSSSAF